MSMRTIGLAIALCVASFEQNALAEGSVSSYLSDGWEIKATSQVSSSGYTQIVLQKGNQGVVCSIYFSVKDKGWAPKGCEPSP
jgi:hypothetical protein